MVCACYNYHGIKVEYNDKYDTLFRVLERKRNHWLAVFENK